MSKASRELWLAPLRGVTIRAFRTVFAEAMREVGFTGAFAPFIPANAGFKASRKIFAEILPENQPDGQILVPQVIGKDPAALREWCKQTEVMLLCTFPAGLPLRSRKPSSESAPTTLNGVQKQS